MCPLVVWVSLIRVRLAERTAIAKPGNDLKMTQYRIRLPAANMLKCSTSLWSADLGNLAAEMRRVEPYSERFHIDVADGHYVNNLLFFPDQVKALRPHSRLPFEVHLMTTDPLGWIEPFVEAGADGIIFCLDSASNPGLALEAIKRRD